MDTLPIPEGAPYVKATPTINRPAGEAFDYITGVGPTAIFPGRATRRHRLDDGLRGLGMAREQRINT